MTSSAVTATLGALIASAATVGLLATYIVRSVNVTSEVARLLPEECSHPIRRAAIERTELSEGDSTSLEIVLSSGSERGCSIAAELSAPAFDYEPKLMMVQLPERDKKISRTWILSSKRLGDHVVIVRAGDQEAKLKVRVVNVAGLGARELYFASLAGAFLGPVLTLPWLLDRLRRQPSKETATKRRSKK